MAQINIDEFKSHYGDDIDIVGDLIEIFEVSYPETLSSIEKAIIKKNFKDLELHAHTLKGMCSNFFSEELKSSCLSLEKMGKDQVLADNHKDLLNDLGENLPKLIEELKELVE
jgi:HPt (histidine-containing phosphotransfer) domain-containing protein